MATIRKRKGGFQVEVRRKGVYECRTFASKAVARAWGIRREAEIEEGRSGIVPEKPFADALIRYRDTVSSTKRGAKWEVTRLNALLSDPIAQISMRTLASNHVGEWRDRRLESVTGSTVNREWNLLSHVANTAAKEWKWLKENPFKEVRRPPQGKPRDRLITDGEIERLVIASGHPAPTVAGRTIAAFLFALETGMRAGEVCSLNSVTGSVAHLPMTKNGTSRAVPLSQKALEIWSQYPQGFGLSTVQLDANFRKVRAMAGCEGFTFHDSRATAITRLAKKVDVLTLARIVGHKNIAQLMVYFRESAEDIAKKL